MVNRTCQSRSPSVLFGPSRQLTLRGLFCLLAFVSRLRQAIGQKVHIVPQARSVVEGHRASESAQTHCDTLRVEVDLVLVPVTVTDSLGRFVTGLDKENFQIYEGKEKQPIRNVSSEDSPVSIGVILDTSGSMHSKIERAREAVMELFETANPQDEFFLITFADIPELVTDFTHSRDDLQSHLLHEIPKGSTS